jgi:hypothetical protein
MSIKQSVQVFSVLMQGSFSWPFPPFPNPKDTGNRVPKFNPGNHEDAPL